MPSSPVVQRSFFVCALEGGVWLDPGWPLDRIVLWSQLSNPGKDPFLPHPLCKRCLRGYAGITPSPSLCFTSRSTNTPVGASCYVVCGGTPNPPSSKSIPLERVSLYVHHALRSMAYMGLIADVPAKYPLATSSSGSSAHALLHLLSNDPRVST